jgi:c-di-GMP-binding flagellar brake protein YcgR
MAFLETLPAPIGPAVEFGPWEPFRVDGAHKRLAALRDICNGGVPVSVGPPGGPVFAAALWSVDEGQNKVHFSVSPEAARESRVNTVHGLWAATYLGETKLQFPLSRLSVEPASDRYLVHADLPPDIYRLARRQGLRLRKAASAGLMARFQHPLAPDLSMKLRVLDISLSGCALWRTSKVLPLVPEQMVREVEVLLDDETLFFTDLEVRHVSPSPADRAGMRIGCTWRTLSHPARDALQGWIETGERRRGRFTLSFD